MVDESLLRECYSELMDGKQTEPLDYDRLQEAATKQFSAGAYDYLTGGQNRGDDGGQPYQIRSVPSRHTGRECRI